MNTIIATHFLPLLPFTCLTTLPLLFILLFPSPPLPLPLPLPPFPGGNVADPEGRGGGKAPLHGERPRCRPTPRG
jgi:hypothetical protein